MCRLLTKLSGMRQCLETASKKNTLVQVAQSGSNKSLHLIVPVFLKFSGCLKIVLRA